MTTEEMLKRFDRGTTLIINVVFPGEYRIGFIAEHFRYSPATPSYYPFEEALKYCLNAYLRCKGEQEIE